MKAAAIAICLLSCSCQGYDYGLAVKYEEWEARLDMRKAYGKSPVPVSSDK